MISLILVATFRYLYCCSSLLSFFEAHVFRPLPPFIESSTSLLLTLPYSMKILDSGLLSLRHYIIPQCLVTPASTKIIHINTFVSEFLDTLTSNIIFLYYISAKHYGGHMP